MEVKTRDLYCGAYILTKGGRVAETKVMEGKDKRLFVNFTFTGSSVEKDSAEYRSGQAVANLATFKTALEDLKDVVYDKLRAVGQ